MSTRIRIARNNDALEGILEAARYSCTGHLVYRKWSQSERRHVFSRYEVIPLDCGYTSRGSFVLYAQDYGDGNQVKQFIVKQIVRFEKTNRRIRPSFAIQVKRLEQGFGLSFEVEDEDERQ